MRGVILYGPPASGKDTITTALHRIDQRYRPFARLKAGPGRTTGYRMTTEAALAALRAQDAIVWENRRYGSTYAIDRASLLAELSRCCVVLHLGQPEAIDAVMDAIPGTAWLVVYLWCPRDIAAQRITARSTGDAVDAMGVLWRRATPEALDRV